MLGTSAGRPPTYRGLLPSPTPKLEGLPGSRALGGHSCNLALGHCPPTRDLLLCLGLKTTPDWAGFCRLMRSGENSPSGPSRHKCQQTCGCRPGNLVSLGLGVGVAGRGWRDALGGCRGGDRAVPHPPQGKGVSVGLFGASQVGRVAGTCPRGRAGPAHFHHARAREGAPNRPTVPQAAALPPDPTEDVPRPRTRGCGGAAAPTRHPGLPDPRPVETHPATPAATPFPHRGLAGSRAAPASLIPPPSRRQSGWNSMPPARPLAPPFQDPGFSLLLAALARGPRPGLHSLPGCPQPQFSASDPFFQIRVSCPKTCPQAPIPGSTSIS